MASGTLDKPDQRAEALHLLERGRAEISAEMRWLRHRVNPKEALRRGLEHHPVLVIGTGVALGLAATLLLWRKQRSPDVGRVSHAIGARASSAPAARRSSLAGLLVGQVAHMLVPLVVMPALENFVKRRLRHATSTSFRP